VLLNCDITTTGCVERARHTPWAESTAVRPTGLGQSVDRSADPPMGTVSTPAGLRGAMTRWCGAGERIPTSINAWRARVEPSRAPTFPSEGAGPSPSG
jgi:hypothetical protein